MKLKLNVIKEILKKKGMTLTDFANKLSFSRNAIYSLIDRNSTTVETLFAIREILNVPLTDLIEGYTMETLVGNNANKQITDETSDCKSACKEIIKTNELLTRLVDLQHKEIEVLSKALERIN